MRGFLTVVVVLAVIVGIVGFSRGWFQVTSQEHPSSQIDVNLRVDPNLIRRDVDQLQHEATEVIQPSATSTP